MGTQATIERPFVINLDKMIAPIIKFNVMVAVLPFSDEASFKGN